MCGFDNISNAKMPRTFQSNRKHLENCISEVHTRSSKLMLCWNWIAANQITIRYLFIDLQLDGNKVIIECEICSDAQSANSG